MENTKSLFAKIIEKIRSGEGIIYVVFVVLIILFSILQKGDFLSFFNMMNILRQTAMISIMAVGMTFALSAGEIDLSVGSVIALSALVTALVLKRSNIVFGIIAGLSTGVLVRLLRADEALRRPAGVLQLRPEPSRHPWHARGGRGPVRGDRSPDRAAGAGFLRCLLLVPRGRTRRTAHRAGRDQARRGAGERGGYATGGGDGERLGQPRMNTDGHGY